MPNLETLHRGLRKLRGSLHVDHGTADATTFVGGMGRSGTTWVGNLINHDRSYRTLFEPFLAAKVPAARGFQYIQYINRRDPRPDLAIGAERILSGKVRGLWVDQENRGLVFRRRLIKEVRCNLMLGWLKQRRPDMPVVLVVRNPMAVAGSWLHLGWGAEMMGDGTDFDCIVSQADLLRDFPLIAEVLGEMDREDPLERIIFQWCVFHLVPFAELGARERLVVAYENLLLNPQAEVERLFRYLGARCDWNEVAAAMSTPSATNFRKRDIAQAQRQLLAGWRSDLSADQVKRARRVLSMFGMDRLYDDEGVPDPDRHPAGEGWSNL
jgi:hypothetical protein